MREMKEQSRMELTEVNKLSSSVGAYVNYGTSCPDVDNNVCNNEIKSAKSNDINKLQTNNVDEDEMDDGKDTGCCGRDRKNNEPVVGATELFKFSTTFDKILMLIGTVGAIGQGVMLPVNLATLGDVIDVFVADVHLISSNFTHLNSSAHGTRSLEDDIMPYIYRFIGIGVASFICSYLAVSCWQLAAERQINTIRKKYFHAVMRQEIGWFDMNEAGEISSRFSEDINKIVEGIGDKMAVFIQWITTWLTAYIMVFTISWKLTLAVNILSPLMIFIGSGSVKAMRGMATLEAKAYAKAGAIAEQALRAIRTVHAFQGQEKEIMRYDMNLNDAVIVALKKGLTLSLGTSAVWLITLLMFAVVMWFGTFLIHYESLQPGKVLPVFFGVLFGSIALGNSLSNFEDFSNARGSAIKVFDLIAIMPKIDSFCLEGLKPSALPGHIEFRNVQFSYPARPDIQVLKDFNLIIEPGQNVALVGPSGCGKSTIMQLLQRFYDLDSGAILVDGHNIKDINLKWLREHIGVVSQEPVLFDASIEENIRFGKIDATEKDIQQAAKEANAHDFIKFLPEGYNAKVGEQGALLSGGQKQRICIARALIRNPKILLLDEATSALDQESEAVVQNALEKAGKGRTTIIIAHRLSTIKHADKIVAISDGVVMEQGTHNDLLKIDGQYNQLVRIQTRMNKTSDNDKDNTDTEIIEDYSKYDTSIISTDELLRSAYKLAVSLQTTKSADKEVSLLPNASLHKRDKESSVEKIKLESLDADAKDVKLSEIMRYNAPEWPLIVLGCFGSIISGGVHPTFYFLLSEFVKTFSLMDTNEQWEKVNVMAGSVIGVAVVSTVFKMQQGYCFSKSGALLTVRLRKLAFTSLVNQDMEYFDLPSNQVGALTTRLAGDAAMVQGATGSKIGQVLEAASTISCAIVIAFVSGSKLSLAVLPFLPLMVLAGVIQGKVVVGAAKTDREQLQHAGKICSEVVDGIRTVVSLSREGYFIKKFDELLDYTNIPNKRISLIFGVTYGTANCLIFFAYAVAFYYGAVLVSNSEMEFPDVFRVFFAIIFGGVTAGQQSSFGVDYTKAKLAAARIISLIKRKPKIDAREKDGHIIPDFKGSINVTNVLFRYPTRPNTTVLEDMSLTINPGETVALVGASGCGKSTTTQLIERFYDVHGGALSTDGQDIRKLNLKWYRKQLGIVSQEPTLFDCSITENIAYGDTSRVVPMAEIIQAAKDANIHNFVSNLPQGYDTNVGEKGAQLSGGQKQRIAIARALVRNPKILLLDEATSALDSESEKIVKEALDKASKNRTCVMITHRLSTIQNADKIAVVSKGKVIEIGTHSQLVTSKGAYYRLLQAQNRPHKGQSEEISKTV